MTYVTDQTSAELRAHMRRLTATPGWHEPLADRLWREVQEQDAEIKRLRAALIACARNVGAYISDSVSTDFLMEVPKEVELVIAGLKGSTK